MPIPPKYIGRFAPSPSGRMHLGNIWAALLSWIAARSAGGEWLLRIEDLDTQRCREAYAWQIVDDLCWLGLDAEPVMWQSRRSLYYEVIYNRLVNAHLTYRCRCRRADILASQAPHASDGRVVYAGTCRPAAAPPFPPMTGEGATRLWVPDRTIAFDDAVFGHQEFNLARDTGDFIIRRADGAWSYQLAVVFDDTAMCVTEVVRGCDLLLSAAQQIYLYRLLNKPVPRFCHIPLLVAPDGRRLSKRDASLSMEALRARYSQKQIVGYLGYLAGLLPEPMPCTPHDLVPLYSPDKLPKVPSIIVDEQSIDYRNSGLKS